MRRAAAIIGAIGAIWLMLVAVAALGAPPADADPAFAQWFRSLQTKQGGSCCSIADCRNYSYRTQDGHYQIDYNGEWLDVPENAVIPRYDNPTGRAVACVLSRSVLCFVKAAES